MKLRVRPILLWALFIYLVMGILVASLLMATPYADNGFLLIAGLWPLFVAGMLFG